MFDFKNKLTAATVTKAQNSKHPFSIWTDIEIEAARRVMASTIAGIDN